MSATSVSDGATSTSNDEGDSLSKPSSRLAKTLTWRPANKATPSTIAPAPIPPTPVKKKKKVAPRGKEPHPAQKPLTEGNMRHQELLSAFTMNFGRTRTSVATGFSGVSPSNSRQASMDAGPAQRQPNRRVSSLAHGIPQEEAETV